MHLLSGSLKPQLADGSMLPPSYGPHSLFPVPVFACWDMSIFWNVR